MPRVSRPLGKNCYFGPMSVTSHLLASGPGWRVEDVVCTAGPHDHPFEERHDDVCIAIVTEGTFQYRGSHGAAVLAPGTVLLGNHGACFECGHEHGTGDRCLAFQFTPAQWDDVLAEVPGGRSVFAIPRLPPLPRLMPLIAAAEAARDRADVGALEELMARLAGSVAATLAGRTARTRPPQARDQRRV